MAMMTGYVHEIVNKKLDFPGAMMAFARAFGALILMRDDPPGTPIPEFEPSPYYAESMKEAKEELAAFEKLNDAQRIAWAEGEKRREIDSWLKAKADDEKIREQLLPILEAVKAWEPPTTDHRELKKFAIQQLTDSIPSTDYWDEMIAQAKARDTSVMVAEHVAGLHRQIGNAKAEYAKEVKRTADRNQWVKDLRRSLKL